MPAFTVTEASPDEREAILGFLYRTASPAEQAGRIGQLVGQIANGEVEPPALLFAQTADHDGLGVIVCQAIPGGNGVVWPPQVLGGAVAVEDALIDGALGYLKRCGTKVAQAFLAPGEPRAAALARRGFRHITRVWYMRRELSGQDALRSPPSAPRLVPAGDAVMFQRTLMRTYDGTLDCPELNGARTPDEIVAGLRAGAPDPSRWWLAEAGGEPAGVLVLGDGGAPGAWEVSYMGIVPEERGNGHGRAVLDFASCSAAGAGAGVLMLIVDARNTPALNVYRSAGFQVCDGREVYLRIGL